MSIGNFIPVVVVVVVFCLSCWVAKLKLFELKLWTSFYFCLENEMRIQFDLIVWYHIYTYIFSVAQWRFSSFLLYKWKTAWVFLFIIQLANLHTTKWFIDVYKVFIEFAIKKLAINAFCIGVIIQSNAFHWKLKRFYEIVVYCGVTM